MSPSTGRPSPPAPPIESLDEGECERLLAKTAVGRLALPSLGAPLLRPVNFVFHQGSVIVRTGDGAILAAARRGESAAFEIDDFDRIEHTGWSVIVEGKLSELPSDDEHLQLPVRPWASGTKSCFVGLLPNAISGMRIPSGRGNR